MRKLLLLLIIVLSTSCYSKHNNVATILNKKEKKYIEETQSFESELQVLLNKVEPASVFITTHELLAGVHGMSASGVSVSADGVIITAGHMVIPGGEYTITYPNGIKVPAIGLGKIGALDLGLLKISKEGEYPFAEMGYSSLLKVGDPVFSLSYPGSFNSKLVVKLGKVTSLKDGQFGFLRTTCLMEPGDSGGPIFDMHGRIVGIRSYIGMSLDENYDAPIDLHRQYWSALQEIVDYRTYPEKDSYNVPEYSSDFINLNENDYNQSMSKLVNNIPTITSKSSHSRKTIKGFFLNLDELIDHDNIITKSYIVSKSSEILNDLSVKVGDLVIDVDTVAYRDYNRDLVLIRLKDKLKNAFSINDIVNKNIDLDDIGKILYSPISENQGILSVIGSADFNLIGKYNSGYLGTKVELKDGRNIVVLVQPDTPASEASLKPGDEILSIDNVKIDNPETLIAELQNKKPYDLISLVRVYGGVIDTLQIELKVRPFKGINHISEEFTDGRSERRDGFEKVFIHDATLKPSECGSPLINTDGMIVGVNMARYSRTSSLGVSGKELSDFLNEYIETVLKR